MTKSAPNEGDVLHAHQVCRRFGPHSVIEHLSLTLKRGEIVGLLGLNGAGKTTALRLLSGTLAAHSGSITIDGHDLLEDPERARRAIGYLPDEPPLYPSLSVDEYLDYCARLKRMSGTKIGQHIEQTKQKTGLGGHGKKRIGTLSRGYRQRLGVAQAILHQPALLLLDEPTSGLDPVQIEEIRAVIRAQAQTAAVLFSTHLLVEVLALCNRVAIIHQGKLLQECTVDDNLEKTFFTITRERGA